MTANKADYFRAKAVEMRKLAAAIEGDIAKKELQAVAREYEKLAKKYEGEEK